MERTPLSKSSRPALPCLPQKEGALLVPTHERGVQTQFSLKNFVHAAIQCTSIPFHSNPLLLTKVARIPAEVYLSLPPISLICPVRMAPTAVHETDTSSLTHEQPSLVPLCLRTRGRADTLESPQRRTTCARSFCRLVCVAVRICLLVSHR